MEGGWTCLLGVNRNFLWRFSIKECLKIRMHTCISSNKFRAYWVVIKISLWSSYPACCCHFDSERDTLAFAQLVELPCLFLFTENTNKCADFHCLYVLRSPMLSVIPPKYSLQRRYLSFTNYWQIGCLFNSSFSLTTKKTSKLHTLYEMNSPTGDRWLPSQMTSNVERISISRYYWIVHHSQQKSSNFQL